MVGTTGGLGYCHSVLRSLELHKVSHLMLCVASHIRRNKVASKIIESKFKSLLLCLIRQPKANNCIQQSKAFLNIFLILSFSRSPTWSSYRIFLFSYSGISSQKALSLTQVVQAPYISSLSFLAQFC